MQLSKHALAQLDDAALAALTPEQLHALSVKLLADLKRAHERLDRNPRNSSRPPSSMAPWERAGEDTDEPPSSASDDAPAGEGDSCAESDAAAAPAGDQTSVGEEAPAGDEVSAAPTPQGEPAGDTREQRRPGQRPVAPGHGRMQRLPIDHVIERHPTHCARCGAALPAGDAARCVQGQLVIDLREADPERPALELLQVKHAYYERDCACGHRTRAEPGHIAGDADWGVALSQRHLLRHYVARAHDPGRAAGENADPFQTRGWRHGGRTRDARADGQTRRAGRADGGSAPGAEAAGRGTGAS